MVANKIFSNTDQHDASIRSDQIYWIEEGEGCWMPFGAEQRVGLLGVLRAVRSMARELEMHGGGNEAGLGLGGVPRKGQLARYTPASRAVRDGDFDAAEEAASAAVVHATGGARYTAHRDGLPLRSVSLPLLLTNPSVCMRETTAILYLTSPTTPWPGDDGTACREISAHSTPPRAGALLLYLGTAQEDEGGDAELGTLADEPES